MTTIGEPALGPTNLIHFHLSHFFPLTQALILFAVVSDTSNPDSNRRNVASDTPIWAASRRLLGYIRRPLPASLPSLLHLAQ